MVPVKGFLFNFVFESTLLPVHISFIKCKYFSLVFTFILPYVRDVH